jgi:anti-sigma factor RsiW
MEYFDGELGADRLSELAHHVADCPRCQRELRSLRHLDRMLHEAQESDVLTPEEQLAYYSCVCRKLSARRFWWAVYGLALFVAIAGSLMLFTLPRTSLHQSLGIFALAASAGIVWLGQYCRKRS